MSSNTNELYEEVRRWSKASLYFFATAVLGFDRMVERLHLPACNYIQMLPDNCGIPQSRRKMMWMPREHFKSTICSIAFPLWLLAHDRNTTIALISAVEKNTKKWLRQLKQIIQYNRMFRWAYPEIRPGGKWDETEIEITRDLKLAGEAQASITASSITSGQASQHYQHIILDDPVNEKVAASETLMDTAKDLYIYLESLLRDWETSTFTLVGTPWGRGDVLEYAMEHDVKNGERLFWGIGARGEWTCSELLKGYPELVPSYTEGEPIFKEECPEAKLKHLEDQDIEKYYLQYLCKPYDSGRSGFVLDLIRDFIYTPEGKLECACHSGHNHDIREMSVIGLCDPAVSTDKKACRSAVVVAALAPCGCRFLLEEWADRVDPSITVDKLVEMGQRWQGHMSYSGIEANAWQKTMKSWLQTLKNEGKFPGSIEIEPLKPDNRTKPARIKSQLWPVKQGLWHKRPYMAKSDVEKNFMWELSRWPYGSSQDLIDAGFGYCEDLWSMPGAFKYVNREGDGHFVMNQTRERMDLRLLAQSEA